MNNYTNARSKRFKKKYIVIESDDWGSIRMASKESYDWFLKKGYLVDQCAYNRNDALESNDDLVILSETLNSVRDGNGNPALITMNSLSCNPDFEKIKTSNYSTYYPEKLKETIDRYPGSSEIISLHRNGMTKNIFHHEFHGREHVHTRNWIESLNDSSQHSIDAFSRQMFTVTRGNGNCKTEFLDAFMCYSNDDWEEIQLKLQEGINNFKELWGYMPSSTIASCYKWQEQTETYLAELGIKGLQASRAVMQYNLNGHPKGKKRLTTGMKNVAKQIITVRNAHFEPSSAPGNDWVGTCLSEIKNSFQWNSPAIISSHRVNFIGSIHEKNRTENIRNFKILLQKIVKTWPDVEFISTKTLIELIENK